MAISASGKNKKRIPAAFFCWIAAGLAAASAATPDIPPNQPAAVHWDGRSLRLEYRGRTILRVELEEDGGPVEFIRQADEKNGRVEQVLKFSSRGKALRLSGFIEASDEAFPCEAERPEDSPLFIRHSVGLSHSLLNRAVCDRRQDWLLSVDFPSGVKIRPEQDGPSTRIFRIELTGRDLILRFRPRYYQIHKGLSFYEPWTYRIWPRGVAGWCSWFAFFDRVTEADVRQTAEVLAETLLPYGLEYLQIDDGYQQTPVGVPDTWLTANQKFPSGLAGLAASIKALGLKPGIWTNVSFQQEAYARTHPEFFVKNQAGEPVRGSWVGFVMDGSKPGTLEQLFRPVYRGLRDTGWEYFKVDALRHLRYEGYNSHAGYFRQQGLEPGAVLRQVVADIRAQIGRDRFMTGCWGIRPELAGLVDACRIGDDGFGYGGLAEYNSFNNVVWRNDPDHIELSPREAWRSCLATSLTGSLFMLTSRPEVYRTPLAEAARRTLPVPFTLPGQVYEVDGTKISQLGRVDTEVSGAGPRAFDADQQPYCHLYALDVNKSFEQWLVLGRTGGSPAEIGLTDLGLDPGREYLVFEYWSRRLLGAIPGTGILHFPAIDPYFNCQVFILRTRQPHPQLVATGRHVTGGGVDLENVAWDGTVLSGESLLTAGDPYQLYLTCPAGYRYLDASAAGAGVQPPAAPAGHFLTVTLSSPESRRITWQIRFARE